MNKGWFKKGHKTNLGKRWKLSTTNKRNISVAKIGSKNPRWKGSQVSYNGLHKWVRKNFGSPLKCERCGKISLSNRKIHWANKSKKYLRKRSDWMRLCVPCHKTYDKKS